MKKNGYHHQHQQRPAQKPMPKIAMAEIKIEEETMISIPRREYDMLRYQFALMDILQRLYKSNGKYAVADLLANYFDNPEKAKEDK